MAKTVRIQVGRIDAEVSEEDAERLVAYLVDRGTSAALRVASRIVRAASKVEA